MSHDGSAPAVIHRPGVQLPPLTLEVAAQYDCVIDARSPAEFALDHFPGAINLPVLSNEERAHVGTVYKQVSAFEARKLGAAIVARNIAAHIERELYDRPRKWRPLVYCWRGGMRSGAMTQIFRSVGWNAQQLDGGYKAWRGQVITDLASLPGLFRYRVICGRTGSGKSRLLQALAHAGEQVLDLEQLARHKGSVLGGLPEIAQPSQKWFESRIWAALSVFSAERPIYVEAESKKVGDLRVPQPLIEAMWSGTCFELDLPIEGRIALLKEEYAHFMDAPARLIERLNGLSALHSRKTLDTWRDLAAHAEWDELVLGLLNDHYDPAYQRSMFKNYRGASTAERVRIGGIAEGEFVQAAQYLAQLNDSARSNPQNP
jgi:tRNA 2-selenouridine synthase